MARTNGKSKVEPQELDLEHELPASDGEGEDSNAVKAVEPPGQSAAAGLDSEIEKLRAERDTLLDRLARSQAEFENARKRAAVEQQRFRDYALADAMRSLLPSLDSFERALKTWEEKAEFRNGVELIYKQLQDALQKLGLQAITAQGERFDPHLHEAVEMVETTGAQDHTITEELQRGYKLKDRLLRPAMVKVARNPGH
jgi:molecular chaperone GrpE